MTSGKPIAPQDLPRASADAPGAVKLSGNPYESLRGDGNWSAVGGASAPLVIENRTSDPSSPVAGRIWLRTDL
jgi:hypothetical protein